MPRRNKKVAKLRLYRDKLIEKNTQLETELRANVELFRQIRKSLQKNDHLRAYAIASEEDTLTAIGLDTVKLNEALSELTLVYRMLMIEREYTTNMTKAAMSNDLLRVRALCEEHKVQTRNNDKRLATWGINHGFTGGWGHEHYKVVS